MKEDICIKYCKTVFTKFYVILLPNNMEFVYSKGFTTVQMHHRNPQIWKKNKINLLIKGAVFTFFALIFTFSRIFITYI